MILSLIVFCVDLLYYKCHKISFKRSGSYIDSPDWTKAKKQQKTHQQKHNKYFQYAVIVALNMNKWKKMKKITKIELFINKHNWKK